MTLERKSGSKSVRWAPLREGVSKDVRGREGKEGSRPFAHLVGTTVEMRYAVDIDLGTVFM